MRRRLTSGVAVVAALVLAGCGAAAETPNAPSTAPSSSVSPSVRLPADGVLLRDFGYVFGPLDAFSLPRTSVVSAAVDQADNVTVVLSAPSASAVTTYLRTALPAAGFTVTADDPATTTLTFTGHGWSGSVTGNARATGILLRLA